MKIDSNLRAAIRSAFNAQPKFSYASAADKCKEAAKALVQSNSEWTSAFRYIANRRQVIHDIENEIKTLLPNIGISEDFSICDEGTFERFGGVIPVEKPRWSFDAVMAKLAKCEPEEAEAILKEHGINWK